METLFREIDSITLPVSELDQSIDWYTTRLGFELEHSWTEDGGRGARFKVYRGNIRLVIFESAQKPAEIKSIQYLRGVKGNPSFNIYSADAAYTYKTLEDSGVKLTKYRDFGPSICFDIIDPDGHYLGVIEEVEGPDNPFYPLYLQIYPKSDEKKLFDGIAGFFFPVQDLEKSTTWYVQHLELELIQNWGAGAGLAFKYPKADGGIALIPTKDFQPFRYIENNAKIPHVTFVSPNAEKTNQWLEGKGVRVANLDDKNGVTYFSFEDPNGNVIGVMSNDG